MWLNMVYICSCHIQMCYFDLTREDADMVELSSCNLVPGVSELLGNWLAVCTVLSIWIVVVPATWWASVRPSTLCCTTATAISVNDKTEKPKFNITRLCISRTCKEYLDIFWPKQLTCKRWFLQRCCRCPNRPIRCCHLGVPTILKRLPTIHQHQQWR